MEAEKKPRRPRISAMPNMASNDNTDGERYEKVSYSNDGERPQGQRPYNSDRQGGYQPRQYNGYQQRNNGYNRNNNYSNHYDRPSYGNHNNYQQPAASGAEGDAEKSENSTESGYQSQQGYQPRQNAYQPRQNAYQPRQNNYNRNQGGYNNNRNQGGYNNNRNQGGYNNRNQGGYNNNRNQGGYNNNRNQGGYNNGNQGGYNNNRNQGGYNNRNQGGYNNNRNQGGYNNNRNQGGYNNRNQGGYNNNRNQGGFRKPNNNMKFTPRPKQVDYVIEDIDPNEQVRLNKYMANAGVCSRREADEYIAKGLVKVNGEVVTELGTKISHNDVVEYDEKVVTPERKCYVLLNKPKDCVTTSDDPNGRLTVLDLVKNACKERIYPVGRLDRNTTGVLLLTNDGDLASKLTHPKFVKKKIYHVWTDKDISEEDMQRIADGITLDDGEIHADAISYVSETDRNQAGIEIHSGRNRIVRRIFESLGYRVTKLDRVYFAGLTKKNLPRGRWRYLTQEEVNFLRMGSFE